MAGAGSLACREPEVLIIDSFQSVLREAAETVPAPAVALAVVGTSGVVGKHVTGIANLETGETVTEGHWWDLASLTKILVTLPEALGLIDRGKATLSDTLASWWPVAAGSKYGGASIAQLLSYNAGAPATCNLYERPASTRTDLLKVVLETPRQRTPGSGGLYSDVGMLLLGEAIAYRRNKSLRSLAEEREWCMYGPPPGPAVATEHCSWRNRMIVGEVHDENAAALGGVSGHAGAFGRLDTVTKAAHAWLTQTVVSPELTQVSTRSWTTGPDRERYGLGFRLGASPTSLGGKASGQEAHGMSGFVGNLFWVEPRRGYVVIVLSNRIHPSRQDRAPFKNWCHRLVSQLASTPGVAP
jgi:CubicO group peptidase (beta-lactamase class C family)